MFAQTKGKSSNHVLIQLNYMASKSVYRLVNAVKLLNPTGKKSKKIAAKWHTGHLKPGSTSSQGQPMVGSSPVKLFVMQFGMQWCVTVYCGL